MYTQHFGLVQHPFSLTPNTRYFMKLPAHQQVFNELINNLDSPAIISKITGEVGTGKTMLCRKILNALSAHNDKFVTAYIPHPILNEEAIMQAIADELRLQVNTQARYFDIIKQISVELLRIGSSGRRTILFIDEAQAMPEETLAAVQLLTTMDSEETSYLQLVLFGQPELNQMLLQPGLQQLGQQIGMSFVLPALNRKDTEAYLAYRMHKAGYNGVQVFTQPALNLLFDSSKGVPRMINILAHKSLLSAYGKGEHSISEEHVKRAITDTEAATKKPAALQRLYLNSH